MENDEPTMSNCHGCGLVTAVDEAGYCPACADRRRDDPDITILGRTLTLSELEWQAEGGDEELKAALQGDTVQSQIAAARKKD